MTGEAPATPSPALFDDPFVAVLHHSGFGCQLDRSMQHKH